MHFLGSVYSWLVHCVLSLLRNSLFNARLGNEGFFFFGSSRKTTFLQLSKKIWKLFRHLLCIAHEFAVFCSCIGLITRMHAWVPIVINWVPWHVRTKSHLLGVRFISVLVAFVDKIPCNSQTPN